MAASTTSTPSQNQTVSGSGYSVFAAAKRCIGNKSECDKRPLCQLCKAIIFIVLTPFMGYLFLAVLVLELHFSGLECKLPRFLVDSASFSNFSFTASNLTANGLVSLRVINPNPNYTVSYDRLNAVLFYGSESKQSLDVARAPPFYQGRLGESIIRFQFKLVNEYVSEEVRGRMSDAGAAGYVDFGVEVKTWIDFEPDEGCCSSKSNSNLEIHCNPVTFGLSSQNGTGSTMIPSRKCGVHEL